MTLKNFLVKFQEDWNKTVASWGWKGFIEKWPGGLAFDPTWPIFERDQDIIKTKILVKLFED